MTGFRIVVTGLVQGVGFRPMVAELAEECNISGQVKNLGGVVEILVSGEDEAVERFLCRLNVVAENVGRIDSIQIEELSHLETKQNKFYIAESGNTREQKRFLPVDFPTCDRCKAELFDPNNRRFRYPFISCTKCGPRYSILKSVPYDRDGITMDVFEMCQECKREYNEKGNIRRHAQTIACHHCGPQLKLVTSTYGQKNVNRDTERILSETVEALKEGKIVAIKDIGGFHFAFSPMNSAAAKRLRQFKHRDKKPFAVMFFDLEELKEYCEVSEKEEELLSSLARPIVLLNKKKDFVPEICKDSDRIGAMLPCNPLQMLLLKETGPLVMTSGNRGGEPIIISDKEMEELMKQGCPDLMLTHDREILTPLDDSIYQVNGAYVQLIRRARGLVPEPIMIRKHLQQDCFAAGGDLKAAFALAKGQLVYLSQYFGDLDDVRCEKRRDEAIHRMKGLLEIEPKVTVGDLHPAYVSARHTSIRLQHHQAHVASVLAECGLTGKVLGIACDGTGFGTDKTIWGSEFFLYEETQVMKRVGHLLPVKLLGGDASAKEADKTLLSYLMEACDRGLIEEDTIVDCLTDLSSGIQMQQLAWKQNINTIYSSSMGRLFDAAAALLDICHNNSYEGECAILLEQAAHKGKEWFLQNPGIKPEDFLKVKVEKQKDVWIADGVKLLVDLKELEKSKKLQKFTDVKNYILAYVFHHAISSAIVEMAKQISKEYDVNQIALSGGSFINRILLPETAEGLQGADLKVYTNEKVPCGDGGIALGQVYLL